MSKKRLRVEIHGAVQGVGFRPFVYRLADEFHLPGWVLNSAHGVFIEVEGEQAELEAFLARVASDKPRHAVIQTLEHAALEPVGYTTFEIRKSQDHGRKSALVLPDIATCDACLADVFDPKNRRYRYPFTNCTDCGPRFTIIEQLPYDRSHTTMRRFPMCKRCLAEYENPLDRRFHAQPNACPDCGPQLALWDRSGRVLAERDDALKRAADAVRSGKILALKGLGGFQLIVDARNESAVQAMRRCKARDEKPFAMMAPTLKRIQAQCTVSPLEASLLTSPQAPIVLLLHGAGAVEVAPAVAPQNPYWGIMLPYTPLHHVLLNDLGFPIVATSGNRSEEPICTDEHQALEQLGDIADLFLVHDRPIARHADDSVARVIAEKMCLLRRARGYAPLPIVLKNDSASPALAVGAHQKNTVALRLGQNAFLSQHVGDLENFSTVQAFQKAIADLQCLYDVKPQRVACDAHPDYLSTQHAISLGLPLKKVQHHHAHVLSCMAEHGLQGPALGIAWDGTGYGLDGTVWGGEFLRVEADGFERVAHLRPFRLPGGEAAVRQPRRSALGLLHEMGGASLQARLDFTPQELKVLQAMLAQGLNAPLTSSAGRLFDAVAALLGLCLVCGFEGQAAMQLEFAAMEEPSDVEPYDIDVNEGSEAQLDWAPMVRAILDDVGAGKPIAWISKRFHHTLVEGMLAVAKRAGVERVVLSGGCFQNNLLTERAVQRLSQAGFTVYWHQQVPPNDGGIALGQLAALDAQKG